MFVLHVHDRLSARGGADWHLLSLLESFPPGIRPAALFGRTDGSVPAPPPLGGGIHFLKGLDQKDEFAAQDRADQDLRVLIRSLKPDLLHVHNILNPHFLQVLSRAAPAVMTAQDHRFFCPGRGKVRADGSLCDRVFGPDCRGCFREEGYFLRMLDLVRARLEALSGFAALIVLSGYMKEELVRAGLDKEKVHVIPPFVHGLDPEVLPPAGRGSDVLFVGRLVWAKGIFDLLEAAALLGGSARLIVAGAGTVAEQVAAKVRELGLSGRVELKGWVAHQDLAAVYCPARLLVCPWRWQEPFGLAGLEAQALGRPVVASEVGGVREWLVPNQTGLLVPPGDRAALAEALQTLLGDPDQATRMGRAGRELAAKRFRREDLMARLIALYRRVVPD